MQAVISPVSLSDFAIDEKYAPSEEAAINRYTKFINWCDNQEEHRMLWLALTFLGLIGMAVPCTLASILTLANNNFTLWILVCAVNVPVMVLSLAAQPTKVIIPILLIAYIIDFLIVLYCAAWYFIH